MALIKHESSINVVDAALMRIKNVFSSGLPVYMAFSGGKDSICMAHLVYQLAISGAINPKKLTVIFVDEEAIFPDVERVTMEWREKFLSIGSEFLWFCLEFKHFSCFNNLSSDESFITWDRNKQLNWIRSKPEFAITDHSEYRHKEAYQTFLPRIAKNGIQLIGIRASESVHRVYSIAAQKKEAKNIFPIYDWGTNDIWLYIKNNKIDYPIEYMFFYQVGYSKKEMRISQFFSVDTAKILVNMNEYYPDLMNKVCKREPNAYMACLYFDSELFRRGKKHESKLNNIDYKTEVMRMLSDVERNFVGSAKKTAYLSIKLIMKLGQFFTASEWKRLHGALIAGDPKGRTLRAVQIDAQQKSGRK